MRVAAVLFVSLAGLGLSSEDPRPPKLPPDIQQAIELAASAPPEFAADALLRIADSGRIPGKDLRRQLAAAAFSYGARAQYPVRLVDPLRDGDTRASYHAGALGLKLDATSLQSRALTLMSTLDKDAARELYERFRRPTLDAPGCRLPFVPDLTPYYEMLSRLSQDVFNGPDGSKNSRLAFLTAIVDRISSHAEVAPAARLLSGIEWPQSQFEILSGALIAKIRTLAPDDRSFSYSAAEIESAITDVIALARLHNTPYEPLAQGYRDYLTANLAAPRCANSQTQHLFSPAVRGELAPLTPEELSLKIKGDPADDARYWESDESKRIFEECLKLRQSPAGASLSAAARQTPEWRRQLTDFLTRLAQWKPSQEKTEEDYYHQRATVYEALLDLTPSGEVRDRVLDDFVAFLKSSNLQQQNPVEWYWHANSALKRARTTQPAEAQRLLASFAASGNVVLTLEAALEKIAPAPSLFGSY